MVRAEVESALLSTDEASAAQAPTLEATIEPPAETQSFEIKDPQLIFDQVWRNIERTCGTRNLNFPKEILWLAGAPGAGKGTMCKYIMEERGITVPPIETSTLFDSTEAREKKEAGLLLGDREVVEVVFEKLLDPQYAAGIVVDGFPRTVIQAECIWLLYQKMLQLRKEFEGDREVMGRLRRPIFRIAVLYVDENESVKRQLRRGDIVGSHNRRVEETGVGVKMVERPTDVSAELARKRYQIFRNEVYEALQRVKNRFHFHFIDAHGTPEEVRERIKAEFGYQSSLELADATFEIVRTFPLASEVIMHARQKLVRRLDNYCREHRTMLLSVMALLQKDFSHIIERQALSGTAIIRSMDPIFNDPLAVNMALDILSERGYRVALDIRKDMVPEKVIRSDPQSREPDRVACRQVKQFVFHVTFEKPKIRRGND